MPELISLTDWEREVATIIQVVADYYNIRARDIRSTLRKERVAEARAMVCLLCRRVIKPKLTNDEIGFLIREGYAGCSVSCAIKKMCSWISIYPRVAERYIKLEVIIKERLKYTYDK